MVFVRSNLLLVLAFGCLLLAGCSFVFVQGPKQAGKQCTTSQIAPTLDATLATSGGALAIASGALLIAESSEARTVRGGVSIGGLTAAVGATVGGTLSARYGAQTVRKCQTRRTNNDDRIPARFGRKTRC